MARAGEERLGLQRLNLTNFANGNSINAGYYFVLFLETIYVYFSQSWMVTIMLDLSVTFRNTPAFEIEATLNCYKKYNYRFTTMFLLWMKNSMHELAIGIL